MKQFGKILKFELKYYFKNKIFIGVTAFLMVLIAVVMFFPRITALFKSEDSSIDISTELSVMLVKMDDAAQADMVRKTFASAFTDYNVQITDDQISVIKDKITSGDAECALCYNRLHCIYILCEQSLYVRHEHRNRNRCPAADLSNERNDRRRYVC